MGASAQAPTARLTRPAAPIHERCATWPASRPLQNHGLFIKGGMGVAFVRNWVYDATKDRYPPYTTNAMALTYGAGWEFRTRSRVGAQLYGVHHIAALGDLKLTSGTIGDVLGNFWTLGASMVIR